MIILDTETGGLDPATDALVAVALFDTSTNESLHLLVQPAEGLRLDPEAEAVHGLTREKLELDGLPEKEVCDQVEAWMKARKATDWCGHNPSFDKGFVNAAMQRCGKKYRLPYRCIDLGTLAWVADKLNAIRLPLDKNGRPSRSLDSVLQALDKSRIGHHHDAFHDAQLTGFAFTRLMTLLSDRANIQPL